MVKARRPRSENKPHFFKVFIPDFTTDKLKIPVAFLEHVKDEAGNVTLMGPSNNIWRVDLAKNADGFFFQNGWQNFVEDHHLQVGELLVFRYDGDSHFTVKIFDKSACEKKFALSVESCQDTKDFGEHNEKKKARKIGISYRAYKETFKRKTLKYNKVATGQTECTDPNKRKTKKLSEEVVVTPGRGGVISQRRYVTKQEIEKALEAAESFKSKNPCTIIVMRPRYVSIGFFMRLPVLFVQQHLPKEKREMILWDPTGKPWTVTYVRSNHYGGAFSGGWAAFTRGNNIEVDDACVFELIKMNEIRVHIFRVVEEIRPLVKY